VSEEKKVTIEMSAYQAAAVRASLFTDTKQYTYDPKCIPGRVAQIRDAIIQIDSQLEEIFSEETNS
tara:strand:- start:277 stop:474 length:198 start_codon:yes stop_codon:yes gene_type:complete